MVAKLCEFGLYEALSQASRCRHAALDPRHYGSDMDNPLTKFACEPCNRFVLPIVLRLHYARCELQNQ